MDLSAFDFRTGKMLMSKAHKSRQRVRYDSSNQVKVRGRRACGGRDSPAVEVVLVRWGTFGCTEKQKGQVPSITLSLG